MTLAELQESIKEEIVLHKGQLKERHWRQNGLLAEAAEIGVSAEEFRRLVNEIGRRLNFTLLDDIRFKIETLAGPDRRLSPADEALIVQEAERIPLARSFVIETWIPAVLNDRPDVPATPPAPPVAPTAASTGAASTGGVVRESAESVRRKITRVLESYDHHIPASALLPLFVAIDYDEDALATEILTYLSQHYFASEQNPQGRTLREKLLSTDWRHLSHWEAEPETEPTALVETAYVSTPPPVRPPEPAPEPARPSGWTDLHTILLAVVVAALLVLFVLWASRPSGRETGRIREPERTDEPITEIVTTPTADTIATAVQEPASDADDEPVVDEATTAPPVTATEPPPTDPAPAETATVPADAPAAEPETRSEPVAQPTPKPYDEVIPPVGELGERRAQKNGKWGYVDRYDRWIILPRYDDATSFRNGKATVMQNGRMFDIDRTGRVVNASQN